MCPQHAVDDDSHHLRFRRGNEFHFLAVIVLIQPAGNRRIDRTAASAGIHIVFARQDIWKIPA